jgi:type II secretory pathway pseudopilin PulG
MTTGTVRGRLSRRFRWAYTPSVPGGYTIIEAMLFLAISGILFVAVSAGFSGQQAKAQFQQSARDFQSTVNDLANDVSTGTYQNNGNFSCTATSTSGPTLSGTGQAQGTNDGCIYVGEFVALTLNQSDYKYYPLAGRSKTRISGNDHETGNLVDTSPVSLATYSTVTQSLTYGAVVGKVTYNGGITAYGFGLMTTFGSYGDVNLASGDITSDLIPLTSPSFNTSVAAATGLINSVAGITITICLQDGIPASRHAELVLGGKGHQLSSQLDVFNDSGTCA